ncbi:MAG: alpha/beta hydrolase family protein [Promethearchaeota archaeon]
MEFKEKEYDGPYEVCGLDLYCEDELFNGVLYYPPVQFQKPYPLIVFFHGFPQLFTLQKIIRDHDFLLDKGYAFIAFNFRGYRYSEGTISIKNQVKDVLKVFEFVEKMSSHHIFDQDNINIIAHDFGAYIALILSSKLNYLNQLLLVSPIINPQRFVYSEEFPKVLHYLNRFLPGNVKGIGKPEEFIKKAKNELSEEEFQIHKIADKFHYKKLKILIGSNDKISEVSEINNYFKDVILQPDLQIIQNMEHECIDYEEFDELKELVDSFFS